MKKRLFTLFLAICMICTLLPFGALADSIETISYGVTFKQTEARSILKMVNDFRTGGEAWQWNEADTEKEYIKGLGNLVYDYTLEEIAMQRATEIAINLSHTRPNGADCFSIYDELGIWCTAVTAAGENIAAGQRSAEDVFKAWQETNLPYAGQGHRRNMLNSDYNAVGMACVYYNGYYYWVQEFGRVKAINSTATSANNSLTTVKTQISMDMVDSVGITRDADDAISLAPGKSVALPAVNTYLFMYDTWPGYDCKVSPTYTWSSSNPSIAKIENGKIVGVAKGSATITVSALGASLDIPVTVHTHKYTAKVINPTCTAEGYTVHTCSCGDSYKDTYMSALGHDYTYKATAKPTKSSEGQLTGTCSRCGKTVTVSLPKLNKTDYTYKVTKAATCTEKGTASYTWKTTDYGTFKFTAALPKNAHSYTAKVTKSTCTKQSYTTYTCSVCGDSYKDNYTEALGHSYENGACIRCGAKASNPFADVKKDSYCYDAVQWAYYHDPQITSGVDATHFAPNSDCTRGQIVTFLWRANGCPEVNGIKNPFKDVKSTDFYYKAVLWAVSKGITTGVDKTHFAPNNTCTRGQAVTFMWRADGQPKAASTKCSFKDVSKGAYYYDAMLWAVGEGITNGVDKTHFAPKNTCTRGQIVTFLYRDMK